MAELAQGLLAPENQAAAARAAANGKLMSTLRGRIGYTPVMRANGEPSFNTGFKDVMVRKADGTLVKQRTEVKVPAREPHAAFSLHGEAPDPLGKEAPQAQKQAQQKQARQKQQKAPHKQQPSRTPRYHVAKLDGTGGKVL